MVPKYHYRRVGCPKIPGSVPSIHKVFHRVEVSQARTSPVFNP